MEDDQDQLAPFLKKVRGEGRESATAGDEGVVIGREKRGIFIVVDGATREAREERGTEGALGGGGFRRTREFAIEIGCVHVQWRREGVRIQYCAASCWGGGRFRWGFVVPKRAATSAREGGASLETGEGRRGESSVCGCCWCAAAERDGEGGGADLFDGGGR